MGDSPAGGATNARRARTGRTGGTPVGQNRSLRGRIGRGLVGVGTRLQRRG